MLIKFKQIRCGVIFIIETTNKSALRKWKFFIQSIELNSQISSVWEISIFGTLSWCQHCYQYTVTCSEYFKSNVKKSRNAIKCLKCQHLLKLLKGFSGSYLPAEDRPYIRIVYTLIGIKNRESFRSFIQWQINSKV